MSESPGVTAEAGAKARTRRAILDAAVTVLAQQPSASLADIAAAAEVGRTTVHRYFPERSDLLDAVSHDVLDKANAATLRARVNEGDARQALARLCQEYFELGDVLTFMFTEPTLMQRPEWQVDTPADKELRTLLERAAGDGTLDPGLPAGWVIQLLWSMLYAAWDYTSNQGASKHEALSVCLRALDKAVAPPG